MAQVTALLDELEGKLKKLYPTIAFGLHERDLAVNNAPPRIVWIPTAVKHGPPRKTTNPRSIFTRMPQIVAHCWAVDPSANATAKTHYDACEALVNNLLVALHSSAWGSIAVDGEEWQQPGNVELGCVAFVTFSPHVPVQKQAYLTVQPTQLAPETRAAVAGDTIVEWGEP